jgi:hypothetical protein
LFQGSRRWMGVLIVFMADSYPGGGACQRAPISRMGNVRPVAANDDSPLSGRSLAGADGSWSDPGLLDQLGVPA